MKHTQGEWEIGESYLQGQISINVHKPDGTFKWKELATIYVSEEFTEQSEANAKLIAAAPDLLEALRFAKDIIDRLCEDYSQVAHRHANYTNGEAKKIEAAIKKATT